MNEAEPKLDRRVQRTRQLLRDALLALIVEQGLDGLTIQTITDRANLRRATFYMHYRDQDELLRDALADITGKLAHEAEQMLENDGLAGKTHPDSYLVLFKHVQQYHALYRNIFCSQHGVLISRHLRDNLAAIILRGVDRTRHPISVPPEVVANYLAGMELSMLMWWLEYDMPYTPEQMADYVQRLALDGLARVAGLDVQNAIRKPERLTGGFDAR